MLLVAQLKNLCNVLTDEESKLKGLKKLNVLRSKIPAVTHVDKSARVQTVSFNSNPRFYKLLSAFKKLTNCASLINTSFNVRGEPIVCSPQDAFRCFMRTEIDILVLENQILYKDQQYISKSKKIGIKNLLMIEMKNVSSKKIYRDFGFVFWIIISFICWYFCSFFIRA